MDLLWRKVSEKEKEDIEKQAKKIIDNFSKKLDKIKEEISEIKVSERKSERLEGMGKLDLDRKIIFENAPKKNKDFIIAEKGKW